jgi:hydroxymethylglutaryl-CoA synthase
MEIAGIDNIGVYAPGLRVFLKDLSHYRYGARDGLRKLTKDQASTGMVSFVVPDVNEDAVSMAANALENLCVNSGMKPEQIDRLQVATGSQVDHATPIGARVHQMVGLRSNCNVVGDLQYACLAGFQAVHEAMNAIDVGECENAVVVTTDIAKYKARSGIEKTQGAGAIALLIKDNPRVLALDLRSLGVYTDGNDRTLFRPLGSDVPVVNGKKLVDCYLKAIEGAFLDVAEKRGMPEHQRHLGHFDHVLFHTPFPKMIWTAWDKLWYGRNSIEERRRLFNEKAEPGLYYAGNLGNLNTGSLFLSLISLLDRKRFMEHDLDGKLTAMFAYGSGSGARFTTGRFCKGSYELADKLTKQIKLPSEGVPASWYDKLRDGIYEGNPLSQPNPGEWRLRGISGDGYREYEKRKEPVLRLTRPKKVLQLESKLRTG